MKPQLVFLLYINRSGSTFLASQLARIQGVAVSVESSFLANLLTSKILKVQTVEQLNTALDAIYVDRGFQNWGIPREVLAAELTAHRFPITLQQLVHVILDLYPNMPNDIDTWILKIPDLQHHVPAVRSAISDAKFLHIVRDPRAVINSQAKAKSSNTRMAMSIDPLVSALKWRRVVRQLNSLRGPDLFEVKYEDLVANHDSTLERVCEFVGTKQRLAQIDSLGSEQNATYYNSIPESQRHLHKNVAEGRPLLNRIDGWRTEMNETDVHLIQQKLTNEMRRLRYESTPIASPNRTWARVITRIVHHRLRSTLFAPIRYARYISNVGRLRLRLAKKISELRSA